MAKRGSSGLSLIVAINKPAGMSSHDVVNQCRSIFNERRVGHMGTLDPLASGVLPICVGPATRLNAYLTNHDKTYRMAIEFGIATSTDDREGNIISSSAVPDSLFDPDKARKTLDSLIGSGMQIPPAYSAIKVNGQKAYEQARQGNIIELAPRPFSLYDVVFEEVRTVVNREGITVPQWIATFHVSKGTYMRSIARDLGHALQTVAHVASLERCAVGNLGLDDCVTLEQLKDNPLGHSIDPLRLLTMRWAFVRDVREKVEHGASLDHNDISLNLPLENDMFSAECCTSSVFPSKTPPQDGEVVALVVDRKVKALYEYCQDKQRYKARCVFAIGVERGTGL